MVLTPRHTLRLGELEDRDTFYTPEMLAIAGALVTIGYDGEPEIHRGLLRSGGAPRKQPSGKPSATNGGASPSGALPASLTEDLTRRKSATISPALSSALISPLRLWATHWR